MWKHWVTRNSVYYLILLNKHEHWSSALSSYMNHWHQVQDRQQKISRNKHGPCIPNLHINSRGPGVFLLTLHNAARENSRELSRCNTAIMCWFSALPSPPLAVSSGDFFGTVWEHLKSYSKTSFTNTTVFYYLVVIHKIPKCVFLSHWTLSYDFKGNGSSLTEGYGQ